MPQMSQWFPSSEPVGHLIGLGLGLRVVLRVGLGFRVRDSVMGMVRVKVRI